MSSFWKVVFISLLIFFVFHTVRDFLQIFNIYGNIFADLLRSKHNWCRSYCDYVTLPPEAFGIVSSIVVLKRSKIGILGIGAFLAIFIFLIEFLLP